MPSLGAELFSKSNWSSLLIACSVRCWMSGKKETIPRMISKIFMTQPGENIQREVS